MWKDPAFGERFGEIQQDVIDEHDDDSEDEAREASVALVAHAHAQRHEHERETCRWNRVLPLPRHNLVVRVDVLAVEDRHFFFQIGDGHLREPFHGAFAGKHRLGIDDQRRLREAAALIFFGLLRVDGVVRAVEQHELNRPFLFIEQ